jgi:methionine-rich copper-binding protein CopC
MKALLIRLVFVLALVVGMVELASAGSSERHMRLVRSEPAADSTVTVAPTALKLYWTEAPRLPVTAIRLTGAGDQAVALGAPAADQQDAKILSVPVTAPLQPGVYTVTWRTAGNDGHVLNGTYKFTYRAAR